MAVPLGHELVSDPPYAAAGLRALGQTPALAATLNVTTTTPGINDGDTHCSLIKAIENANADAAGTHTDCPEGNGADTIVLPSSSIQTLTRAHNNFNYANGLPFIASAITIEGNGSTIECHAADSLDFFRSFAVNGMGNLTLSKTTVSGCVLLSAPGGGGIANFGGTVTLNE